MNQLLSLGILCIALCAGLPAYGAGSGGYSGGGDVGGGASQSPKQAAKAAHNEGLRHKRRALGAEEDAADAKTEEKRADKLEKAKKEWMTALANYQRALQLDQTQHKTLNEMGYALRKVGDYETAIKAYNAALQLEADFPEAIEYRAEAFLALGAYDQVKESYMQLVSMDKDQAATLMEALQAWQQAHAATEDDGAKAFSQWIVERASLAQLLGGDAQHWN